MAAEQRLPNSILMGMSAAIVFIVVGNIVSFIFYSWPMPIYMAFYIPAVIAAATAISYFTKLSDVFYNWIAS